MLLDKCVDAGQHTVSIQGSIVLLRQAERPSLPVTHSFLLANRFPHHFKADLSETDLLRLGSSAVETLQVAKICDLLPEVHLAQMLS
jgi:hypothetical protein